MRKRAGASFAIAFILVASLLCAAQTGKVESVGPLTDNAVPEAVRQALDEKGYRLTLEGTTPACELWIHKSIPAQTKQDLEGVAYPQIAESTLVAVIHFPRARCYLQVSGIGDDECANHGHKASQPAKFGTDGFRAVHPDSVQGRSGSLDFFCHGEAKVRRGVAPRARGEGNSTAVARRKATETGRTTGTIRTTGPNDFADSENSLEGPCEIFHFGRK